MNFIKIGVFYDGNYFLQVSNYYAYGHARRKRLSVAGIHDFIRHQVAEVENMDVRSCKIVDAHYFRGRLNAYDASQRGDLLFWDRAFDDILMSEGVTTHYMAVKMNPEGLKVEKGIDVWLALESFEIANLKKLDVVVLIASDGDYVPLVRKLNSLGVKVMVMGWDIEYVNEIGVKIVTRTSQELMEEASYPLSMHNVVDDRAKRNEMLINNLFVATESRKPTMHEVAEAGEGKTGEILSLKNGFGFIKYPPNNVFFHFSNLIDLDFQDIAVGDTLIFDLEKSEEGHDVAKNVRLLSKAEPQF
jgi:uncharacterized LabA/DUF88 family protein/cold shock CspA family protein